MTFDVDQIRVASPCHARWADMDGDERARFCRQCSKHVYNLSALTREQIGNLVREKEGKFCGRFYRRADGSMLTADCPSRLRQMRARLAKIGGPFCALFVSVLGCSPRQDSAPAGHKPGPEIMGDVAVTPVTCSSNSTPVVMGQIVLPATPATNTPVLMGEIAVQPELGRVRIDSSANR